MARRPTIPKDLAFGLTPKQRLFAELLAEGHVTKKQAAELAGYSKGNSASVRASNLLRDPRIIKLIRWLVETHHQLAPAKATAVIESIADGQFDEKPAAGKLRLDAAKQMLGVGGMSAIERKQITIDQTTHVEMSIDQALQSLRDAGIKLQGEEPPILDVTPPKQIEGAE